MNAYVRTVDPQDRTAALPDLRAPSSFEVPDRGALGPLGTLVQKLIQVRQERPLGLIVTFTSVSPGEGVTSIIESLSWDLVRHAGQAVLVTSPAALSGAQPLFRITEPVNAGRVWRLDRPATTSYPGATGDARDTLRTVREHFGFILVDCPPLKQSSAIYGAAPISDGFVLVVASGQTKRREVEAARRLLGVTSVPVLGMVLNKHQTPVPRVFSNLF